MVGKGDEEREYWLSLGRVDPIASISGSQARLLNLGYYDGEVDGEINDQLTTAILLFQDKYKLSSSGENDADTQAKLKEIYGC